jgi:WD40-like Beta Propeller Repeat
MNETRLTDAQIRDAFDRRARHPVPSDVRTDVLKAVAAEPQRWGWAARTTEGLARAQNRRTILVLAAAALLIATIVAVAIVGSRTDPGRRLAFISGGDLWVAGVDDAHPRLVWDTPGTMVAYRPTWVDDDTLLVQETNGGVYAVDVRTSTARLLVQTGEVLALSPDHLRVAVAFDRPDGAHLSIIEVASGLQVNNSIALPVFAPPANLIAGPQGGPHAWAPDGTWLLGQGMDTNVSATSGWIYRLDLRTGEIHDLAKDLCCGLNFSNPVMAPDGSSVVYVDHYTHETNPSCHFRCGSLWSVDPVTGRRLRLTGDADSAVGPVFSPDGAWIAFAEYVGPGYDVSIVRSDGTGRRKLTNLADVYAPDVEGEPYTYLAWDANGSGITFMRGPLDAAERQLWHVTIPGLQLQRLGTITASEFTR